MANQNLTTTQNTRFIPSIVANEVIGALPSYLNLGKTVTTDSSLTPIRVGQVVSVPKRGVITANQKVQGSPTTKNQPTATNVSVTVDQHWEVTIGEEDFTQSFQQVGSALPGYAVDGVIALAEKIESKLATHILEFDNIDAGTSAGDAQKGIIDVRKALNDNKVPMMMPRYGYISTKFTAQLLKESAFLDPKLAQNQRALVEGAMGRVSGFDMFEGQLVPTTGSPAHYQNFFYTQNALVLASRPLRAGAELAGLGVQASSVQSEAGLAVRVLRYYDTEELGVVYTMDVLFGSAVLDSRQGFVLESV